jgi:hypothetical protein
MLQLTHDTPEERRHLAQDIAPDLVDQPSPRIYHETIAYHGPLAFQMQVHKPYESDHDFGLWVICEKHRFQKKMSRRAALNVARDCKERES